MESTLFLVGRLLLGGYFIFNGFNHFSHLSMMAGYAQSKGVPSPTAAVAFSGLLLLIGGLSILLGLYPTVGTIARGVLLPVFSSIVLWYLIALFVRLWHGKGLQDRS